MLDREALQAILKQYRGGVIMDARRYTLTTACLLVSTLFGWSQTGQTKLRPDNGEFKGSTYTNDYFGITYVLPEADGWYVNDELMSPDSSRPNKLAGHFVLMILDRHTGTPLRQRILMMADDADLYSAPLNTPQGFVVKLTEAQAKMGHTIVRPAYAVEYGGRQFQRSDFDESYPGGRLHKSMVATQVNEFMVSWIFAADSAEELNRLVSTLSRATVRPPVAQEASKAGRAGSPPAKRVRISGMTLEKFIVEKPVPPYPDEARNKGVEGPVRLRVLLGRTGEVASVEVVDGDPLLTPAAVAAVRYWKFKPYILNGEPVEVESQVTINFALGASKE